MRTVPTSGRLIEPSSATDVFVVSSGRPYTCTLTMSPTPTFCSGRTLVDGAGGKVVDGVGAGGVGEAILCRAVASCSAANDWVASNALSGSRQAAIHVPRRFTEAHRR